MGSVVRELNNPPKSWIQLSSLAIFGDSGDLLITESTPTPEVGPAQQVEVCQRWEAAYREATVGIPRAVLLRPAIGIGGLGDPATRQLSRLARLGLGGKVGSGQQWVSWIAAGDLFALLHRGVIDDTMRGLYHLTSPNPIRNSEFMAAYRDAVGRRFGMGSPEFITRIGAWILGSDPALALTGRRCVPHRLQAEGYRFETSDIETAVRNAVIPIAGIT